MYRTLDARLVVAVDGDDAGGGGGDELEGTVHLFKLANDVTYRRFAPARPRPPCPFTRCGWAMRAPRPAWLAGRQPS